MTLISDRPIGEERAIPRVALWLNLLGVAPLAALTLLLLIDRFRGASPIHLPFARLALIYGAIILSFFGGARWGMALRPSGRSGDARMFVESAAPPLLGFGALLSPGLWGFYLLFAGFMISWAFDRWSVVRGVAPSWHGRIRSALTIVILTCIAVFIAIA